MEVLVALMVGALGGAGIYLILRARTVSVAYGLMLLSYGANLMVLSMGRLGAEAPPLIGARGVHADPLPQALVLTAIVIGFGMIAFFLVLAMRAFADSKTDHVDGREPGP